MSDSKRRHRNLGSLNPIIFEIVRNSFIQIVNEMDTVLRKSAFSPVLTEASDVSAAIFDRDGNLVAQGDHDLPVFLGVLEFACKAVIREFGFEHLGKDDVVILNDPFLGGTHFNDVATVRPVYFNSILVAFVCSFGHWTDVGGKAPGSFAPDALEYFEEGIRIPPLKMVDNG